MKIFRYAIRSRANSKLSWLRSRLLALAACSCATTYAFFLLLQWNVVCLNLDIQLRIDKLCKEFHGGHVFGNLCPALCNNQISVLSCHSMHKGKSTVFTATWNKSLVVIKNSKVKSEYIPIEGVSYNSTTEFPSYEEFTEMVTQSIQVNFGISIDNLLPKLYPFVDFNKDVTKSQMINLWELSQDNEYVSLMLHNHSAVFPKILGSCGTFYAMEYAKPISSIDTLATNADENLSEKFRLAISLIDLLDTLEFSFPNPLHMCDVKLEHFGVLRGSLVLLDVDTVFPKHIIDRSVADGRTCTEHADCDFFDCRSLCNRNFHICDTPVVNNNLQLICQKVFVESKLLTSKHLPNSFQKALKKCAQPMSSDGRHAATVNNMKELRKFLNQFLNSTKVSETSRYGANVFN